MQIFGLTDTGRVRTNNQDSFAVCQAGGATVAVVCDGMGGARAGQTASRIASETFVGHMQESLSGKKPHDTVSGLLREAAMYANVKVYDRAFTDRGCRGMGTTLVGIAVSGGDLTVVNVGDSRAYLISGGTIEQLTRDHSFVQQLVDLGEISAEQARTHPQKNIITRSVGSALTVESDIFEHKINRGDVVLLCSDGVSNLMDNAELLSAVQEHLTPERICSAIIGTAIERGAPDNVTAVAVCI